MEVRLETSNNMKIYTYDIETYPNLFCVVFNSGGEESVYEISARINDLEMLVDFYCRDYIKYAIGFNNCGFDAQVLEYLVKNFEKFKHLQGSELVGLIFKFAQEVIEKARNKEFLPYAEWNFTVDQIDLFKIQHYNNKARMTS